MQKFTDWLLGRERTARSIVANYLSTVEELAAHAEQRLIDAAQHAEDMAIAEAKKLKAEADAAEAKLFSTKLGDLFN